MGVAGLAMSKVVPLRILVVSTAVSPIGVGRGGGVEITLASLVAGLQEQGHSLTVLAPAGSRFNLCPLLTVEGELQIPCQTRDRGAPVTQPGNSVLAAMWHEAWDRQAHFDVVLNLGYDWLPLWCSRCFNTPLLHLVSMASLSDAMDAAIREVADRWPGRLAFHSHSQMQSFGLRHSRVVGNGFAIDRYRFRAQPEPLLGWVGRIAPEKGLEDAAAVAAQLQIPLAVWGFEDDPDYKAQVVAAHPHCDFRWQGFVATEVLQQQLGRCRVLLMTPRWQEAFGNGVVEAMACGVPVAAYRRGGPGETIDHGVTGVLVEPDDVPALARMVPQAMALDRQRVRERCRERFGLQAFAARLEDWLRSALAAADVPSSPATARVTPTLRPQP